MKHRIKNGLKEYFHMVFKDGITLMKKGGLSFVLYEIIYKLLFIAIFYPVLIFTFEFTLEKAGFRYLTNNYFYSYLRSPYTIIAIILMFIILAFYVTYEVSCLAVCFDVAHHGHKMSVGQIFRAGFKMMGTALKKKKLNSFFHISVISMMMNITLLGFFFSNIKINSNAAQMLKSQKTMNLILGIVFAVLFVYCFIHIFTVNYMAYDGESISEGKRKSRLLIRRRGFRTFFVILGWNIIVLAGIYLVYFLLVLLIIAGVFILDRANLGMAIYLSIFRVVVTVVKIIMPVIAVPVSFAVISGLFYRYRSDNGNEKYIGEITEKIISKKTKIPGIRTFIAGLMAVCLIVVNIFYLVRSFDNNPFYNVEYFKDTMTMAHRGCSYNAPENTMMAFENAVKATADYIELDVHETKDGVIVVIHDDSLKRTTGVNKKIYDVTYDEIKELDAGSYFGPDEKFKECRIPTLEEVMDYTKGKIKLNIEIKLSDKEPHLVQKVAELIEKYEYLDECYVTSMNYKALTQIKEIDENIKTGYVLTEAYGNFYNIENVDAFSVNLAYINKNVVDAIHYRGKKLFVWTINNEKDAERLVTMGVDAIISDNPVMTRKVVYAKYSNSLFENVLSTVFKD